MFPVFLCNLTSSLIVVSESSVNRTKFEEKVVSDITHENLVNGFDENRVKGVDILLLLLLRRRKMLDLLLFYLVIY